MAASRVKNIIGGCAAIALFLVIAALLLPIFARQHTITRQSSCQSNEKLIGLAILQYSEDFDEKFPCGLNKTGVGWAGTVQNYIKSTGVFHCPDDPTKPDGAAVPDLYALNRNLQRGVKGSISQSGIGGPRQTVMVFEITDDQARLDLPDEGASKGAASFSATGDGTDGSLLSGDAAGAEYATGYMGKRPVSTASSQFDAPTGRHYDGSNFLMGDGHVKYLLPQQVSTGTDAIHRKDDQTGGIVGRAAGTANTAYDETFSTK